MNRNTISLATLSFLFLACADSTAKQAPASSQPQVQEPAPAKDLSGLSKAYFASGCFWCVEAVFESVKGVEEAVSGYAGGFTPNPTYKAIGTGITGHAETVEVHYDPSVVSYETLLDVFFGSHDPTTFERQGPDEGSQYRSIAFYQNEDEKRQIEAKIQAITDQGIYHTKIVTEVVPFEKFYPAEEYHQNYERDHPDEPYVRNVSIPRLNKFKAKFPDLLK